MIYAILFWEFFKIGLFAIGGGMATIPFLYDLAARYPWYTVEELGNMIAISEATPGPTGINMATAAGYSAGGVFGSVTATFALVLPAYLAIVLISRYLMRFYNTPRIQSAFHCLRPVVTAQITAALVSVMQTTLLVNGADSLLTMVSWKAVCLYLALFLLIRKTKLHPVVYLGLGGLMGWVLQL